jgi:hypothetical protein
MYFFLVEMRMHLPLACTPVRHAARGNAASEGATGGGPATVDVACGGAASGGVPGVVERKNTSRDAVPTFTSPSPLHLGVLEPTATPTLLEVLVTGASQQCSSIRLFDIRVQVARLQWSELALSSSSL